MVLTTVSFLQQLLQANVFTKQNLPLIGMFLIIFTNCKNLFFLYNNTGADTNTRRRESTKKYRCNLKMTQSPEQKEIKRTKEGQSIEEMI